MKHTVENKSEVLANIRRITDDLNSLLGKKIIDKHSEKLRKQKIEQFNKLLISEDLKLVQEDSVKDKCTAINLPYLEKIIESFSPSESASDIKKDRNQLPQIVFLGNFRYLSLSDQRHVCKSLGFEYYKNIPFGVANDNQMLNLAYKWAFISDYTKLIVVGDAYDFQKIKKDLYKKYLDDIKTFGPPIFEKNKIPIIIESEFIKLHKEYPNITNSSIWTKGFIKNKSG